MNQVVAKVAGKEYALDIVKGLCKSIMKCQRVLPIIGLLDSAYQFSRHRLLNKLNNINLLICKD